MKQLFKSSLVFIVTFIAAYLLLFAILFYVQPSGIPFVYRATSGNLSEGGGTWLKLKNFDKNKKWDVIVLGSSHAYRGYDPKIFENRGYSMYNLGTSNQHMLCTYSIVKYSLTKENTGLVILDIYDRVFSNEMIESMSDIIQNTPDDRVALNIALHTEDIRAINMITLRYFNKTIHPLNKDTLGYYNGYQVARKFINPAKNDSLKMKFVYKTNKKQLKYLDKLLTYFNEQGIKVVLAEHPLPSVYTVKEHDKFLADINPILKKHNVAMFDFTFDPDFDRFSLFSDPTHLNHLGVPKYNERLIDSLVQKRILPAKGGSN